MQISVPTIMALAADPVASLIDTAFIGHIGLFVLPYYIVSTFSFDYV
jgi:Na+-driven multidrug efflux pump